MAVGGSGSGLAWAGAVSCALAGGTLAYVLAGEHGALGMSDRSSLVSVAAVLPALLVSVIGLWWQRPGAHEDESTAVARLAREVRSVGEPQWMHSLGGELTVIDVTFAFRPYAHARAAELPPTPAGQLGRVVEDYRAVRPRRLVITGEPGAGKTVLARKLVMELNKARGEGEPVAVLIALADWDAREALSDWIARHLEGDFGMPSRSARRVMEARMVLPVLDGLDEMDAEDVETADSRGRRALEALARYQDGTDPAPLVLTCRTKRYDELEAEGSHILDAARIEIDPVEAARAVRFLEQRGSARRPALWRPVLDELRSSPGGVLAVALSTPWRLTLTATVYEREGDPGELVGAATVSADAVAELLLSRFIGAVAGSAPKGAGRYQERVVHARLHRLAMVLGVGNEAETDLVLHRLGDRVVGPLRAVAIGGLVLAAVVPVVVLVQWRVSSEEFVMAALAVALIGNGLFGEVRSILSGSGPGDVMSAFAMPPLGSPLWRLGFRRLRHRVVGVLGGLLMLATGLWAASPTTEGGSWDLWILLLGGLIALMIVVVSATVELDSTAVGPSGQVRAVSCVCALTVGVVASGARTSGPELIDALFSVSLLATLFTMGRGWIGYLVYRTANPGLGLRLPNFLDWCVTAGLLRTSGIAYQFRHREFQEWLVRHPEPVPLP